jgi:hypothetical protein
MVLWIIIKIINVNTMDSKFENESRKNTRFVIIILPLLFLLFILSVFMHIKYTDNIFDEYPVLKKDEAVNETITLVEKYKGTTLVETKSGESYGLRAYNWAKKRDMLYYHLEIGDSLVHKPGSRLLYLYKKETGEKIRFELDFLGDGE